MRFNKTKCKVLNLGQDNPQYQHRLGDEQMENSPVRRTWGCWWVREMDNCCPICLDSWKEISYILPCLHQFCYSCILQWWPWGLFSHPCIRYFGGCLRG
uniref:RING-type domain-containing protein n=1 Tax=Zosterops lateralis melanops TaxID=1220523 RepID=A0A8D2PCA0_ZOSLA